MQGLTPGFALCFNFDLLFSFTLDYLAPRVSRGQRNPRDIQGSLNTDYINCKLHLGLDPRVARVRILISLHSFHSVAMEQSFERLCIIASHVPSSLMLLHLDRVPSSSCPSFGSSVTSVGSLPINLATSGVKMTVGGKRRGDTSYAPHT
jgi:hypothetical protein